MEEKYYAHGQWEYLTGIPPHSITQSDYSDLKTSYNVCLSLYWIEKKFEIVTDNYYEFEEEIKTSYDFIVSNRQSNIVKEGQKQVSTLNRRLVNLLCSIRMYRDQVLHDISQIQQTIGSDIDLKETLDNKTHELYDKSFAYQLMELLRNYTQHQGLVIERVAAIIPFYEYADGKLLYFAEANFNAIKEIEGYHKKIKKPIKDDVEWLNLIGFIREYYQCWCEFHNYLHDVMKNVFSNQFSGIQSILQKYFECVFGDIGFYIEKGENGQHFLYQPSYLKDIEEMYAKKAKIDSSIGYINKECFFCFDRVQVTNSQRMTFRCNTN